MTDDSSQQAPQGTHKSVGANNSSPVVWGGSVLIFLLLMGYFLLTVAGRPAGGIHHAAIGRTLSALQLAPLTAEGSSLQLADLEGKVTLINYWGTWCPPCRVELPHMVELQRKLQDHGDFAFVSVSCEATPIDKFDILASETAKVLEKEGAGFAAYHDPGGLSRRALAETAELDTFGLPATVLLDRHAAIRGLWLGYAPGDIEQMEQEIEKLLEE